MNSDTSQPAHLKISHVSKTFGQKTVLHDFSLDIAAGEIICLLGPSGCGKTTLLRLVAGLEKADSGQITLAEQNLAAIPPHQRNFGMMFQSYALFPHLNVAENVAFGLKMQKLPRAEQQQRVAELLAKVGMTDSAEQTIETLSGGEKQRVALARTLAPRPQLLLLDEPLGALDRALREELMLNLRALLKETAITTLYVTHDQSEAFAIADRIVLLNDGKIEQIDSPQQIYARPRTPFAATFLGFKNIVRGVVDGDAVWVKGLGRVTLHQPLPAAGTPITLLIRPDAARLSNTPTAPNTFAATLETISFRGRHSLIQLRLHTIHLSFEWLSTPPPEHIPLHISLDPNRIFRLA